MADLVHRPPDRADLRLHPATQLRERRRRELGVERDLIEVDDGATGPTEVGGITLTAGEHAGETLDQWSDFAVELGELAVQGDLHARRARGRQDDPLEGLTADVGPAPPRDEEGVDAGGLGEPAMPGDDGGVRAVVRAHQRTERQPQFGARRGFAAVRPQLPALPRPLRHAVPSVVKSPDRRVRRSRVGADREGGQRGDHATDDSQESPAHFARRSSSTLACSFATCSSASPNGVGATTLSRE